MHIKNMMITESSNGFNAASYGAHHIKYNIKAELKNVQINTFVVKCKTNVVIEYRQLN